METKSEWRTEDPPGTAKVEVATIIHGGREFTNMGAIVDHERGYVVGYPHETGVTWRSRTGRQVASGELRSWSGEKIGEVEVTGHSRGFYGAEIVHFRAYIGDRAYHGKGSGWGMILRLRACKGRT